MGTNENDSKREIKIEDEDCDMFGAPITPEIPTTPNPDKVLGPSPIPAQQSPSSASSSSSCSTAVTTAATAGATATVTSTKPIDLPQVLGTSEVESLACRKCGCGMRAVIASHRINGTLIQFPALRCTKMGCQAFKSQRANGRTVMPRTFVHSEERGDDEARACLLEWRNRGKKSDEGIRGVLETIKNRLVDEKKNIDNRIRIMNELQTWYNDLPPAIKSECGEEGSKDPSSSRFHPSKMGNRSPPDFLTHLLKWEEEERRIRVQVTNVPDGYWHPEDFEFSSAEEAAEQKPQLSAASKNIGLNLDGGSASKRSTHVREPSTLLTSVADWHWPKQMPAPKAKQSRSDTSMLTGVKRRAYNSLSRGLELQQRKRHAPPDVLPPPPIKAWKKVDGEWRPIDVDDPSSADDEQRAAECRLRAERDEQWRCWRRAQKALAAERKRARLVGGQEKDRHKIERDMDDQEMLKQDFDARAGSGGPANLREALSSFLTGGGGGAGVDANSPLQSMSGGASSAEESAASAEGEEENRMTPSLSQLMQMVVDDEDAQLPTLSADETIAGLLAKIRALC